MKTTSHTCKNTPSRKKSNQSKPGQLVMSKRLLLNLAWVIREIQKANYTPKRQTLLDDLTRITWEIQKEVEC